MRESSFIHEETDMGSWLGIHYMMELGIFVLQNRKKQPVKKKSASWYHLRQPWSVYKPSIMHQLIIIQLFTCNTSMFVLQCSGEKTRINGE